MNERRKMNNYESQQKALNASSTTTLGRKDTIFVNLKAFYGLIRIYQE